MTRSVTCSWAAKVPDWRSMWSTRVVFPWSTCAMIAMFRRPSLRGAVPVSADSLVMGAPERPAV